MGQLSNMSGWKGEAPAELCAASVGVTRLGRSLPSRNCARSRLARVADARGSSIHDQTVAFVLEPHQLPYCGRNQQRAGHQVRFDLTDDLIRRQLLHVLLMRMIHREWGRKWG